MSLNASSSSSSSSSFTSSHQTIGSVSSSSSSSFVSTTTSVSVVPSQMRLSMTLGSTAPTNTTVSSIDFKEAKETKESNAQVVVVDESISHPLDFTQGREQFFSLVHSSGYY